MTSTFSQIFMALRAQNCFVVTTDYKSILLLHMLLLLQYMYSRVLSTISITVIRFASSCIIVASVQQASVSQQRWSHFLSHAFFTSWDFSLTLFNVSANSHHYHFPAAFFAFKALKMLSFDFGGIDDQEHLSITSGPCFLIKYFLCF